MNGKFAMLARRELWEHKSLWIAPLVAAALVIVGALFGEGDFDMKANLASQENRQILILVLTTGFVGVISAFAVASYLLDCLYGERKDRSILFWKSLPVSDTQTVLSKLFVAMVLVPVACYLVAMLTHLMATGIINLRFEAHSGVVTNALQITWAEAVGRATLLGLFGLLWYAPIFTWLMLASVVAKRGPLGYAVLPLLVPALWERWMLGTHHIGSFLSDRFAPWGRRGWHLLDPRGDMLQAFSDPQLWLGLAVAAGMLYIIIRLRQFRDDT
jgi:ABC-2 type transport system permease protein